MTFYDTTAGIGASLRKLMDGKIDMEVETVIYIDICRNLFGLNITYQNKLVSVFVLQ